MPSGPAGPVGAWSTNAPAPYPGPPPVPAGVDPRAWSSGQWAINPMYRGAVMPAQGAFQAWAPHPSWGPAVANANYNPYKRVPNPGSAEYWNTKLLENPLGLENMHIKDDTPAEERRKKDTPDGAPHTPWVWVPKELRESSELSVSQPTPGDPNGQPRTTHGEHSHGSRAAQGHPSEMSEAARQTQTSRATYPGSGREYAGAPGDGRRLEARDDSAARRAQAELQNATSVSASSYAAQQQQPSQQQRQPIQLYQTVPQRQQSRDPSPRRIHSSPEHHDSSPREGRAAAPAPGTAVNGRTTSSSTSDSPMEGFSSKVELHPTFSTNIIRTPGHYASMSVSTPPRRASHDDYTSSRTPISPYGSTSGTPRRMSHDDSDRYSSHTPAMPPTPHTPSYSNASSRHSTPQRSPLRSSHDDASRSRTSPHSTDQQMATTSSTPRRSNSLTERTSSHPPVSPYTNGHTYGPASTPTRSNSTPTRHSSASSHSSAPSSLYSGSLPFSGGLSEEPEGLLSPLVGFPRPNEATTPSTLGRHHTYPTLSTGSTFETIPEERSEIRPLRNGDTESKTDPYPPVIPDTRTVPRSSEPADSSSRHISRSQTYPSIDPGATPRAPVPSHAFRDHSPTFRQNPLPPPPKLSSYSSSASQSFSSHSSAPPASAAASSHRVSPNGASYSQPISSSSSVPIPAASSSHRVSPNGAPYSRAFSSSSSVPTSAAASSHRVNSSAASYSRRRVHKGFWNRRGDHLLVEHGRQYIVYAPREMANPPDLADYPRPTEGFMDHDGNRLKYDPAIEELPDSLPRHGDPPRRPYEHFVQYV
ncbi:hypothetical protein OBBRIDRAFT_837102 [Obba rivulosa]|uniref:Uncharacterized protein n=1 Tax=Obba rivulosa TaxID=1052685 RepID=A0A8E2ATC3_9APHY|nr:hypothetical protein OBBRIDRAFT_837102 [Obba rivulosa]